MGKTEAAITDEKNLSEVKATVVKAFKDNATLKKPVVWEFTVTYKELKDKSTFVFYNPLTWFADGNGEKICYYDPRTWSWWGKWLGTIGVVGGVGTGSWFGYRYYTNQQESQKAPSSGSKVLTYGLGAVALAGAGTYGAYKMGYFGDEETGFINSVTQTVTQTTSSDPKKKLDPKVKPGMSGWVIAIIVLLLLAAAGGGAYYYFVIMAEGSEEDGGDIEEASVKNRLQNFE